VPVEAQACGAAVIALGRGGATETIVPIDRRDAGPTGLDGPTGLWFAEQTVDALAGALIEFEKNRGLFAPAAARRQALHFTAARFAEELFGYLDRVLQPAAGSVRRAA